MALFERHRSRSTAISLRTASVLAIICFVAGAILPSRVFHLAVSASHAAIADRRRQ